MAINSGSLKSLLLVWVWLHVVRETWAVVKAKGFNAFYLQTIRANTTCGNPPEQFFNTTEGYIAPRKRTLSVCDAGNPLYARPPSLMNDDNLYTSWQSRNNIDEAYIAIDLEQPVYGKQIVFNFGYYRRPGQIAIYKSSDFGKTYHPWHYMVSQREECTSVFGIPESEIFIYPDEEINRVLCQTYSGYPFEYGEETVIELNGEQRGDGSNEYESIQLLKWMKTTNVHIKFSGLYRKFDYIDTRWHHYDVSEISLIARCDCGGHGDGVTCPLDKKSGARACVCADNTCGSHCEICCPAYNQYPWQRGSRSSWISDNSTACRACNCHRHSDVCHYDASVAANRQSLNMEGVYEGGGVCDDCQDNTMGVNCEKCKPFFYRPANTDPSSKDACPSCGCSEAGSRPTGGGIQFMECISDSQMAALHPGKSIGDCFCKVNVIGKKCDICKDQFYRLEVSNPSGCRACNCNLDGTVQRLNLCHKDFFGQCPCKTNVKLRDCSKCKDGYYDLRNTDVNGCKWCDCDVGASISPYICDKITGVCSCRAHIKSRRCKEVEHGYYYPLLHYIQGRRNIYKDAESSLKTLLVIPHDSYYYLRAGYKQTRDTNTKLTLNLKSQTTGNDVFRGTLPYAMANKVRADDECFTTFEVNSTHNTYFLKAGTYEVDINPASANEDLELERVIAIPVEFVSGAILFEADRERFRNECDPLNNNLRNKSICMAAVYSMTVKFEDGALPCKCDPVGCISAICREIGGECDCKPGVGGRDCSQCLPEFFNFSKQGCQPCNCNGPEKICDPVSGQCVCPPNTQGRACEACQCNGNSNKCTAEGICIDCQFNTFGDHCEYCKPGFYGDALLSQCLGCNCNFLGAFNNSCDMKTGQCYCRPGVIGNTCSQCAPLYFGLSSEGCSACNCNHHGSERQQCDDIGQCPCFSEAEGLKCDKCQVGYYGLPNKPCLGCNCNIIGTVSNTFCISDAFGQCVCKPGVEGRACDRCQKQYAEFGPNGCKRCPLCTRKLQSHADDAAELLEQLKVKLELTGNLTDLQTELKATQTRKQQVELNAIYFENRLHQGRQDYSTLLTTKLIPWNTRLTDLLNEINTVHAQALGMRQLTMNGAAKMTDIYLAAMQGAHTGKESDRLASSAFSHLVNLNALATVLVSDAYDYTRNAPTFEFDAYEKIIDHDLFLSNELLTNITNTGKEVMHQQTLTRVFFSTFNKIEEYFNTKEQQWATSSANFFQQTQQVHVKGQAVIKLMNQTQNLIESQLQFITSTQNEHDVITQLLSQTETLYQQSHSVYEKCYMHTQAISGGIEVLFLKYNPQNSMVRVNVLRGYHFVARDYPTMTSDPFFTLEISPRWYQQGRLESAPKKGTLDPAWDWPVGGTYTFFITKLQMEVTKLIITVYDHDDDGAHDFMGEVVIDLHKILPLIQVAPVRQTYTLRPQGYDQHLGQFSGAGENSILDLQNMLYAQINDIEANLQQASSAHALAENTANNLQQQAQLLESTFEQAKQYASKAVSAVNTYNQIYKLINSSLEAAIEANSSVHDITTLLQGISISSFTTQTDAELLAAQQFLTETRARNITQANVAISLRSETLGSSFATPRSSILINGHEYHPQVDGHTVLLVAYTSGKVMDLKTFRTDIDANAGMEFSRYLDQITSGVMLIIVKQGKGQFSNLYQNGIMNRLVLFGAYAPYLDDNLGAYAFLGYRKYASEVIPWLGQDIKIQGAGAATINRVILLQSSLQDLIDTANKTFHDAIPQWGEIDRTFPELKTCVAELLRESTTASVVEAALGAANIVISQAVIASDGVLQETVNLLNKVNQLSAKFNYLVSASANITNVISQGQSVVNEAEGKISEQQAHLEDAMNIMASFVILNGDVGSKQTLITEKLQRLNSLAAQMPFTIDYAEGSQSTFPLVDTGGVPQKRFVAVQFDFKPRVDSGILWVLVAEPNSMSGTMALYMKDKELYFGYNLGMGNVVAKIQAVSLNEWSHVQVSRIFKTAFVVYKDVYGVTTTKKVDSPYYSDKDYILLNANSRWFLNGFPPNTMAQMTEMHGKMSGCYDNMFVNDVRYNLWDTTHYSGGMEYTPYRYPLPSTSAGNQVTMFGSGYIKQQVGEFSVSDDFSALKLEFRTLRDNVVIFGVTGQNGDFIYGLYLYGGKLMFKFATSLGNDIALITTRNTYNNGDWYAVTVKREGVNATLTAINTMHPVVSETKANFIGLATIPSGVTLLFGAPSPDSQVSAPVTGRFAGDMRNLELSDVTTGKMVARRWDSPMHILEQQGYSYYGMIHGQIVRGVRFYGYMWWLKKHSYAALNGFLTTPISSVYLSFKTSDLTGMILYKPLTASGVHFYMGLMSGQLMVALMGAINANTYTPFYTTNHTLSDGKWHNTSVAYTAQGYQIQVDGEIVYLGWLGNTLMTVIGTGEVYVGGVPQGVRVVPLLPTTSPLTFQLHSFMINRLEQDFFSYQHEGVSYAGIMPGANTPRPPPSCAASFPDLTIAPDPTHVRFGKVPWVGYQSYIGYQLAPEVLKKYFTSSFVIKMSFKAMLGDGIIFYIANSETNPTQYVSLELIHGKLRYEFYTGNAKVRIETGNVTNYAENGKVHKVYLLRIYQFGAMLIPDTMEYKNDKHAESAVEMSLTTPLYIGGIPNSVYAPHFSMRRYGFNGCLQKFEVSSGLETHYIDFAKPDVGGTHTGTTSCYSNIEPGVFFNGNDSWVNYGSEFELKTDFQIEMMFRTYQRNGLLFYLFSKQTPQGVGGEYGAYALLELVDGKLIFHYKSNLLKPGQTFEWADQESAKSFYLCDQKWHKVKVTKSGRSVTVVVDNLLVYGGGFTEENNVGVVNGPMYIGGVKDGIAKPGSGVRHFNGCLRLVSLDGNTGKLHEGQDGNNVLFGCATF